MKPKIIFSDFDGTLTLNGALSPDLFKLFELKECPFVIVSGASFSTGYFLTTYLPINICIMEGGAVILRKRSRGKIEEEILVSKEDLVRLRELEYEVQKEFPGFLATDRFGRKTDRAVEWYKLDKSSQDRLKCLLYDRGASFSFSNIHLNFWYGKVSKYQGIQKVMEKDFQGINLDDCLYFGDSPNDQSVFRGMKHTVGVSNIAHYLDQMEAHPSTILTGEENCSIKGVYNFLKSLK